MEVLVVDQGFGLRIERESVDAFYNALVDTIENLNVVMENEFTYDLVVRIWGWGWG